MNLTYEPASPFVVWTEAERRPLEELHVQDEKQPLVVELLSNPEAICERLVDPARLQSTVLGSLAALVAATAFFASVMISFYGGPLSMIRAAGYTAGNTLLALAAALGPIYATSIILAARLPLARLVGVLVTSAATGALILAAAVPLSYFSWKIDLEWAGPLSVLAAFLASGMVTGARVHRGLFLLAERIQVGGLDVPQRFRVGILARMSLVLVAFTVALAFWGFDALSKVG